MFDVPLLVEGVNLVTDDILSLKRHLVPEVPEVGLHIFDCTLQIALVLFAGFPVFPNHFKCSREHIHGIFVNFSLSLDKVDLGGRTIPLMQQTFLLQIIRALVLHFILSGLCRLCHLFLFFLCVLALLQTHPELVFCVYLAFSVRHILLLVCFYLLCSNYYYKKRLSLRNLFCSDARKARNTTEKKKY